MNRSAARLVSRTLRVGISTALLSVLLFVVSAHTVRAGSCVGDCDGSGDVAVNKIITLVNVALGNAQPSACPDGVPSGEEVNISLILQAVNAALNGCTSVNITGTWYSTNQTTGTTADQTLVQNGSSVTGSGVSHPDGSTFSLSGSISGFSLTLTGLGNGFSWTWTGTVSADGKSMAGNWTSSGGGSGTSSALKVASATPTPAAVTPSVTFTSTPTPTPTAGPFVGVFSGTAAVTAGQDKGLTAPVTIAIGANGAVAAWIEPGIPTFSGTANLTTGAVTLHQLSEQLSGEATISLQLRVTGSSVTGSGGGFSSDNGDSGTITITTKTNITSEHVGVYLGMIDFDAGPDSGNSWPIELFVANDGTAGGDTFDPEGDGFQFLGTVNFASGAFTLAVNGGSESLTGVTGNLTGNFVSSTLANGTFTLSNGDTGTVSFPKVAP